MKLHLLASFLLLTIAAFGQGTIVGTVTDKATGDILLGATVMLESSTSGAMSDFDGKYTIAGLKPGTYKLIARFIAYNAMEKEVTITGGETVTVDFPME